MSRRRQWDDLAQWVRESIEIQPTAYGIPSNPVRLCGCQEAAAGEWWLCAEHDAANDAIQEAFVEVPVRWCTVHRSREYLPDADGCIVSLATQAVEPCRLVPCYINTTENP